MAVYGQCMCKKISVTVTEQAPECYYCHCDNCIRQGGGGGTYEIFISKDKVKVDGVLKEYVDRGTDSGIPLYRYFCGECGCPIYSATEKLPGKLVLKQGIFQFIPRATVELYCKNKQSWEPAIEGAVLYEKSFVQSEAK